MEQFKNPLRWVLVTWLFCLATAASAETPAAKPFADKKVVLQISDQDAYKQTLVLNVASNLVKHYGPDRVDVEIVAFGPGLRLLFAENSNSARIEGLSDNSGVRFSACENTTRKVSEKLGHAPQFNPKAQHVAAGVVRILDLIDQGYVLIKP